MITKSIIGIKNYLLNTDNILLDENYIYVDPETMNLFFAYLPFENNTNDVKTFLLNMIIKLVKFQEEDCDNYIQRILENIKSEMFNIIRLKELLENLLGQDIKKNTSNEIIDISDIADKTAVEKPKSPIKRGEVKIPNLPTKEFSNVDVNIKSKAPLKLFSKINLTSIIIQPVLIIIFVIILSSNFVRMSENPKITAIILTLIFIGIDVLAIRILNEKKEESSESYKPLKYITEKMRENGFVPAKQIPKDKDNKNCEETTYIEKENYNSGETVILRQSQPQDTPFLQERDGGNIIKVDRNSIL